MNTTANISLIERKNLYFIGIGGIGMSAIARYFLSKGKNVAGYDKTSSPLTEQLSVEGIAIHFDDDPRHIHELFKDRDQTLIVYTPAIPADHNELNFFRNNGFDIIKRAEVLGLISAGYFTIAIAGTHGKTTTSSILTHILKESGKKFLAFVGGINQNSNTNVSLSENAEILVTEADEYDRSFLKLHPDIALITSLDADHLDIYGNSEEVQHTYRLFSKLLKENGKLITIDDNKGQFESRQLLTYSIDKGDFYASNIRVEAGKFHLDLVTPDGTINDCTFGQAGRHNLENALGATAIAKQLNINNDDIKNALSTYKGVKRRFEMHINNENITYIDDYAHHPQEIKACLESVKELFPGKKITGIFQPHLYTRTRDFANGFAESLDVLDELILLDIYPAREKPIEGITPEVISRKMTLKNIIITQKEKLLDVIENNKPEVLVTMGAGDIDRLVDPITKYLSELYA